MREGQSRRLAAILAADIAGYSALMSADEARTVRDLKGHQAVVLPLVGEFGGRIIDTAGDGILAEFPSVVNAVQCAVAIQSKMAERNAVVEPERRMQFRIGINIGDVVYDEARIYGDGINVAARLEAIAEPGGICISGKVYEEVSGRIDLAYQDIGERNLKNIARPVRVYRVQLGKTRTGTERQLTAILAADVAGYSRLVENDEEGTLTQWKAHWHALIEPKIGEFSGRIVRVIGDGVLVEFASVVDAVRCGVEVQRGMAARNADVPHDRRIEFRMGINFGELIIDDGDFWGDAVNIAARLQALAEPGDICVSGRVQEDAKGKLDIVFEDAGEQQLKNIARSVRVYRVRLSGAAKVAPELALPSKPSIAVLPFDNMSTEREQEYFCDGIVEDIITGLSRIRWLFVIARNSSFVYKGRAQNIKQIGRELGIRYALEGSVRKSANQIRITAQLIEAENGAHLWAERYDRPLYDIFAVQDEITTSVVGAIEPSLRKAEIDRVRRQRPNNLNAYDLVLRSLPFVYALMPKQVENAIPLLRDALKLEPNYGLAHALLSWCFHIRFNRGGAREADRAVAIRHAHEAIAHGADDATALAVAAFVIALDEHDATTALKLFDQALVLSESNIFALTGSAVVLAWMGNTDKTIERAKQALRFSPFDSLNFRANSAMSIVHFYSKRYAEAADEARTAIGTNATFSIPRAVLAASLLRLGRMEEARVAVRSVLDCEPSFKIQKFSHLALEPAVFVALSDAWRELGLP